MEKLIMRLRGDPVVILCISDSFIVRMNTLSIKESLSKIKWLWSYFKQEFSHPTERYSSRHLWLESEGNWFGK